MIDNDEYRCLVLRLGERDALLTAVLRMAQYELVKSAEYEKASQIRDWLREIRDRAHD